MKELIQQKPYLLWLLVALLFLQFFIVPVVSWQDEKVNELFLIKKRLTKAEKLLANEDQISKKLQSLQNTNKTYQQYFYRNKGETAFQLEQQEIIEQLAEKHKLTVSSVGWQVKTPKLNSSNVTYELQLRFKSQTKSIIPFQIALEQNDKLVTVVGMSINIRRHIKNTMGKADGLFRIHYTMDASLNEQ